MRLKTDSSPFLCQHITAFAVPALKLENLGSIFARVVPWSFDTGQALFQGFGGKPCPLFLWGGNALPPRASADFVVGLVCTDPYGLRTGGRCCGVALRLQTQPIVGVLMQALQDRRPGDGRLGVAVDM